MKIEQEIQELRQKIVADLPVEEKSELLAQIGFKYRELEDYEKAISAFEEGLKVFPHMGDNYKQLLALYTKMQIESAIAGNSEKENYYSDKMNELKDLAKKMVLS